MTVPAWGTPPEQPLPPGTVYLVVGGFGLTDECYAELVEGAANAEDAEARVAAEQGPRINNHGRSAEFFVNAVVTIVDGVPMAVDEPKYIRRYWE